MAATNQTNNSITLSVNMFQFINEFFADTNQTRRPAFDYSSFRNLVHSGHAESIEIKDDQVNTLLDYDWRLDFYAEYGLLRYAYETEVELQITETEVRNIRTPRGKRPYWKYVLQSEKDGLPVTIQFYTRWRIMAFIEAENEKLAEIQQLADDMQHLCDKKPVLCLESISDHFKRACREIHKSYESGYYDSVDDVEYPNCYEVVIDQMQYSDNVMAGCECMPMVCQAVDSAFSWVKLGLKSGVLNWLDND